MITGMILGKQEILSVEKQEIKSLEKQEMESWEVQRKKWYHGVIGDHWNDPGKARNIIRGKAGNKIFGKAGNGILGGAEEEVVPWGDW